MALVEGGTLPVPAKQTATGTIFVAKSAEALSSAAALYARVFSSDQKKDLEGQVGRLVAFANARGLAVSAPSPRSARASTDAGRSS